MSEIEDACVVELPRNARADGEVVVADAAAQVPFRIQRTFAPPGIWNTVSFGDDASVVAVLCDRPYEEHEYVRDYAEFLSFRESVQA